MSAVSGVLTQKPDSPDPVQGSVQRFSVEQRPKKNKDGFWNKLKNEKEGYGSAYEILKAERIDDYTHPQHGTFHQFSLLLSPQEDAAGAVGEAQSSNGVSAPAAASDVRGDKIDRAVAFKAAARVVGYQVQSGKTAPENVAAEIEQLTDSLLQVLIAPGAADPKGPWMEAEGAEETRPEPSLTDNDGNEPPF